MEIRYSKNVTEPWNKKADAEDMKAEHKKTSKKLPTVLDFKQGNDRCVCPIGDKSEYLNIVYGSAPLYKQPMCLKSSGFSFEIQNNRTGSRKISNVDDYLIDTTPELTKKSSKIDISETKKDSLLSSSGGVISFAWKNGMPCFVFSLEHDLDIIYVANLQKKDPSIDKSFDYLYFFSSVNHRRELKNASSIVGKMMVSSSIILNSGMSKLVQTDFVLFGSYEDYTKETRNSFLSQTKDLKRYSNASTHKHKLDDIINHIMDDKHDLTLEDFSSNLELAAAVVKNQQLYSSNKEVTKGGWGLKFLEKAQVTDNGNSKRSFRDITKSIDVLIPNSFHTAPINSKLAPSSLLQRWKSKGGGCDCGGWDTGCPLDVYHKKIASSEKLFQEEHDSVCLFLEGKQNGEPTLTMTKKGEGMYQVNLKPPFLSDLQCFSVAVAILHSQTPELHPNF